MANYGWRPVFIGIGLISLAWVPAWIKWMPRGGAMERSVVAAPSFAEILRQRSFWGVCAGHFSINYLAYFMLTLLPALSCTRTSSLDAIDGEGRQRVLCD